MRPIDLIVLHHSATPDGRVTTVADIDRWHAERGFRRDDLYRLRLNPQLRAIGYHHVIYVNGAIASGRAHEEVGAHARGHNANSIGVCLVGTDRFTPAQWASLRELVTLLREKFPGAAVAGHGSLSGAHTACPGFSVADWLAGGMNPLVPEHLLVPGAAARIEAA